MKSRSMRRKGMMSDHHYPQAQKTTDSDTNNITDEQARELVREGSSARSLKSAKLSEWKVFYFSLLFSYRHFPSPFDRRRVERHRTSTLKGDLSTILFFHPPLFTRSPHSHSLTPLLSSQHSEHVLRLHSNHTQRAQKEERVNKHLTCLLIKNQVKTLAISPYILYISERATERLSWFCLDFLSYKKVTQKKSTQHKKLTVVNWDTLR